MGRPLGSKNKKSIWLLQSLANNGYDYEKMFTKFLNKAALGDRLALDMCHLLVKLVPYLANMPKTDHAQVQIETLVINRLDRSVTPSVDAVTVEPLVEGIEGTRPSLPPSPITDGHSSIDAA